MEDFIKATGIEKDVDLFHDYLREFGPVHGNVNIDRILTPWYENKSKYLLPIFGGKTIIRTKVDIEYPIKALEDDIADKIIYDNTWYRATRELLRELATVLTDDVCDTYGDPDGPNAFGGNYSEFFDIMPDEIRMYKGIRSIIGSRSALAANAVPETYNLKPGPHNHLTKPFKIQAGQKPFRVFNSLIKLCREYFRGDAAMLASISAAEEQFEEMRIVHSQILNQKRLAGNLCLSIHPLDYITISDNNCDWDSCMTWTRDGYPGEYRLGTLEMMNSPCIVVAYLDAKEPFSPLGDERKWSNKKWRELFIVDRNFISGVRGYPYTNHTLEIQVLNILADMCEKYDWPQYNREPQFAEDEVIKLRKDLKISTTTHFMYNDSCYNQHNVLISTKLDENAEYLTTTDKIKHFSYSGPAYCLECGELLTDKTYACTSMVRCSECEGIEKCAGCGGTIYDNDDYFEYEGEIYCEDCRSECGLCGESIPSQRLVDLMFAHTIPDVPLPFHRSQFACACQSCVDEMKEKGEVIAVEIAGTPYANCNFRNTNPVNAFTPNVDEETLDSLDLTLDDDWAIVDLSEYRVKESA